MIAERNSRRSKAAGPWRFVDLVAAHDLKDAEAAALNREIDLASYLSDLPPCTRVLIVDPRGAVATANVTLREYDRLFGGVRE